MDLPKVINNVSERVVDDLKEKLSSSPTVSIAAASFSIYAYEALKEELEGIEGLRFIFTSPTFITERLKKEKREFYIPKLHRERNLYGSDFEIKLRNKLEQKAIARECADWIRRKVHFKSNTSNETMGGFLHIKKSDKQTSYVPFNEFTTTELGCERGNSIYSMVNVMPSPFAEEYLKAFNEQWNNSEKFQDVTSRVLEYIETVYNENSPEFVYFITLYNIFNEFLDDISEDVLPNEKTGFKSSQIWNKLYNFQRDAVLAIINKLEKYNGCILADSVGLGKTFTALAVIKYYENCNKYHDDIRRWLSQEILRVQSGLRLFIITWAQGQDDFILKEVSRVTFPELLFSRDWNKTNQYKRDMHDYVVTKNKAIGRKIANTYQSYTLHYDHPIMNRELYNPPLSTTNQTFPFIYYMYKWKVIGKKEDLPQYLVNLIGMCDPK